jgi:glyoxylase-like metal-dependent hydrolase (beta-lactamase superfamily II)
MPAKSLPQPCTAGLSWGAVHHVILTHYHPDHIGSVGEVLAAAAKATTYAGAADGRGSVTIHSSCGQALLSL